MLNKLGFGGATLTNLKSLGEILYLLDIAYSNGIRHFDTAPLYGQGYSEVIYGKFLSGKRQQVTLTTKFGLGENNRTDKIPVQVILPVNYIVKAIKKIGKSSTAQIASTYAGLPYRRIERNLIKTSFEKSLNRLKTDYIDYYLLHEGLPSFLTEEARAYLLQLKSTGHVRHIGIGSNAGGIKELTPGDIVDWDVLQYEQELPNTVSPIVEKFPSQLHFHHSCLRNMEHDEASGASPDETAGYLLARATINNPKGKVIFSTRSPATLKKNIKAFLKYTGS